MRAKAPLPPRPREKPSAARVLKTGRPCGADRCDAVARGPRRRARPGARRAGAVEGRARWRGAWGCAP